MSTEGWKHYEKVTVPAGGDATFVIPTASRPHLEKLTIFALSGARVVGALTFQPQINGEDFGVFVVSGAGALAEVVFQSIVGTVSESLVLPTVPVGPYHSDGSALDPLVFSVLVSNAGAAPYTITMAAAAIGRNA